MTTEQFDARVRQIEQGYAHRRDGADAYRDQELARLFHECEWTQERIAQRMGKTHAWVSFRLTFGAFLDFVTTGYKSLPPLDSLTERAFRRLYQGTRGPKAERFGQVVAKLGDGLPVGYRNLILKPGYRTVAVEVMADGQWRTVAQLTECLTEQFSEIDAHACANVLQGLSRSPPKGWRVESKKISQKCQYRMRKASEKNLSRADVLTLYENVHPLIEELHHWGRTHEGLMSPVEIRKIATKLERIFDSLLAKEKT